jgi:ubiquinone biosynthesis protein Coq4
VTALLAFSWAQTGTRSNALLTFGASLRMLRERGPGWIPTVFRSWRRGRAAICLAALPWEKLLPLPLDDVRAIAGVEAGKRANRKNHETGRGR